MRLSGPPQRPDQRRGRTLVFRRPRRTTAHASGPAPSDGTHLSLYVFQRYAAAGTNARTSLGDTLQKPRVVLQAVLQPVILRLKADQNARRLAVARAQNLPSRSLLE